MIYLNIDESNYIFEYGDLKFYFSSLFYKNKFEKEFFEFVINETRKLEIKFKCSLNCQEMIMLLLYKKIEKRGFKVLYKGNSIPENYHIDLTYCEYESIE